MQEIMIVTDKNKKPRKKHKPKKTVGLTHYGDRKSPEAIEKIKADGNLPVEMTKEEKLQFMNFAADGLSLAKIGRIWDVNPRLLMRLKDRDPELLSLWEEGLTLDEAQCLRYTRELAKARSESAIKWRLQNIHGHGQQQKAEVEVKTDDDKELKVTISFADPDDA